MEEQRSGEFLRMEVEIKQQCLTLLLRWFFGPCVICASVRSHSPLFLTLQFHGVLSFESSEVPTLDVS